MRLIHEANAAGRVTYSKCHVFAPNNAYPVQEVRLDFADFAALHAALLHPGFRGWCEKMMTMFPEAGDAEKNEGEETELSYVQTAQDDRRKQVET